MPRPVIKKRKCKKCRKGEPEVSFKTRIVNGRRYPRHLCRRCFNDYTERRKTHENRERRGRRHYEKLKKFRTQGLFTERWIVEDARRSDRKHGRDNDITKEFVLSLISGGCASCGETQLRMPLDRKDNALGHLQSNVVPACERCNYARRDMPYEAWLLIAPAMRQIREQGLFGDWVGGIRRRFSV